MGIIISKTDFVGEYNVPDKTHYYNSFADFILRYEGASIRKMLGVALGDAILTYYPNRIATPNAAYDKIINAFSYQAEKGEPIYESEGLKMALIAFVYYEYMFNGSVASVSGVMGAKIETANDAGATDTVSFAENKFNRMLPTIYAIQFYCYSFNSTYPTFDGMAIKVKASNLF